MISTVALFDLDGTLSSGGTWNSFFKYYFRRKRKRAWIIAFWATHLPLGLLSKYKLYSKEKCRLKWMEDLGGIFKGASNEEVLEVFHWAADNYIFNSLRNDVVEILNQHKQRRDTVVIVSAIFSGLAKIVGQRLGVPNVVGTKLEVIDGRYTGKIVKPPCFGENKAKLLKEFLNQNGLEIDRSSSFAYADSIFDAPLLELVGNPVATYPDEDLRRLAEHNGWGILPDFIRIDG
jgi:HAD superfamily hydrolase (TIGR01490 family)